MLSVSTPKITNISRKSHRIDVHKHADAFLERLERAKELEQLNKVDYKPNMFTCFLENLANGLETMFKGINIKA